MKQIIFVTDYELDDNDVVVNQDGGRLEFNDVEDFIMMWNFLTSGTEPLEDEDEEYLIAKPKEIGKRIREYCITGDSYKVWKAR